MKLDLCQPKEVIEKMRNMQEEKCQIKWLSSSSITLLYN
jgi:hypothetical protein